MKVKIHAFTYLTLLISFLSGYFEYIYILLITIFIHESGHYIFSRLINIKCREIIIYPFGGLTILDEDLNIPIYKELISLLGGIIFQLLFFYLMYILYYNGYITYHVFSIIKRVNILLISFNFLPIIPLDGGKLLNIILDCFFYYKLSNKLSIIISILFLILFIIINNTIFSFILVLFLIKSLYYETSILNIKYTKFLFERYSKQYKFNKTIIVKDINSFKRGKYHIVNNISENIILYKMFDRSSRMC